MRGITSAFVGILICFLGSGCQDAIDLDYESNHVFQLATSGILDSVVYAGIYADSILALNPPVRYWDDSLAYEDSLDIAYLYRLRTSHLYHRRDTVQAIFSFIETMPWSAVWTRRIQAKFWNEYSNDLGEAMVIMKSPNMAALAFDAFTQAERLAFRDSVYYTKVLATREAFVSKLRTMPDSVQEAYGPRPASSKIPIDSFGLLAVALGFILLGGGGGTWYWRRHRKRSAAVVDEPAPVLEPQYPRFHTEKTAHLYVGDKQASRQQLLSAVWWVVFHPDELAEVRAFVSRRTQTGDLNQLSFCLAAGLLVNGLPEDEEQLVTLGKNIRARLIRFLEFLSKGGWASSVYLPSSDQAWRTYFTQSGHGEKPPF